MTKERAGEIAYLVLLARMKKEGLKISRDTLREIGSLSQRTGLSKEDLHDFMMHILPELIGNALGYEKVSLSVGDRISDNKKD